MNGTLTETCAYYVYGFRGRTEFFGTIHRDGPDSLGGVITSRRERGWRVFYRSL